ncbi:MAG: ubiquinol-cytochrome C chaperone family protein [Proteobacteria bacterium]|nr:ubiquinol-cytochrome C chaperone family protein [Pseudomonadota bacterium]
MWVGKGNGVAQSALGDLIARVLQGPGSAKLTAAKLFERLVAQARTRVFYEQFGVPDTVDGRFDMVVLHTFLIFQRLRGQGDAAAMLAQALYDALILDLEASLRQLGAGDVGVGKRIRVMTEALQGRIKAYETALTGSPLDLEAALRRNLYGTAEPSTEAVRAMADYLRRGKELADRQPLDRIQRGIFEFPSAPAGMLKAHHLD